MAFSGGTFSRLYSWASDQAAGIKIRADRMDNEMDGFATGLSTCLLKDGTQTAVARIPFAAGIDMDGTTIVMDPGGTSNIAATTNNIIVVTTDSTAQVKFTNGTFEPETDNDIDLGTASKEFKDAYFDGTVNTDALVIGTATAVTDVDTDLSTVSASDDTLASAKAIKAYVDSSASVSTLAQTLTAGNTSGGTNIIVSAGDSVTADTISETTAAAGVTVDSLLIKDGGITAAGTSTFAGQTISDLGAVTTADINGGTIDGATIGASSAAAGTFTSLNATGGGSLTGTWSDLGTVTTLDLNGGTIDGTTIGSATPAAGNFTNLDFTGNLTQNGSAFTSGGGLFKGDNGTTGDATNGPKDIFRINEQELNTDVTITSTENASATGPLSVASGTTLTVDGNLSII